MFFTNNFSLKYLVNNLVLGGIICKWLLLFQESKFEMVVKQTKHNMIPNHILTKISREVGGSIDDELLDP